MDKVYVDTVRLMLGIAPHVFQGPLFAMKGGTALNIFLHDMPRLSVDSGEWLIKNGGEGGIARLRRSVSLRSAQTRGMC